MHKNYFAPDEPPAGGKGPDGSQQQQPPPGGKPEGGATPPPSFEAWLDGQPKEVKALYETHTERLTNTVKAVRDERDDLHKQLKAASKKLEEGSDARKALDEFSLKLDAANRKADFYEAASKPELGLRDVALAWLVIQAGGDEFVNSKGVVNFDALKEKHPALFGKADVPPGHAGSGRENQPGGAQKSMDNFIRSAAGKS